MSGVRDDKPRRRIVTCSISRLLTPGLPCLLFLLESSIALGEAIPYRSPDTTRSPSAVVVKVRRGYMSGSTGGLTLGVSDAAGQVRSWAAGVGGSRIRALWPGRDSPLQAAEPEDHPGRRAFIVVPDTGVSADELARRLERLPWVEYAEVDGEFTLHSVPNDPLYPREWPLENTGQLYWSVARISGSNNDTLANLNGTVGADLKFPASYNHSGSKAAVPVGIVDTGIDTGHEDIADRLYVNLGEIPDNGIDDDHDGFVDDVFGWDFSGDVAAGPIDIVPDNDVTDQIGHGTHVAGTVAATVNNGIGIAGVADSARVFASKIFPNAYYSVSAQAIYYAVLRGARVINMSWGGSFRSKTLGDALQYAYDRGVVLVASMGNSGQNEVFYPSGYPSTIAVGASTANDRLARFSTFNDHIAVIAPGEDILSLRAAGTDLYADGGEPVVHVIDNRYYIASGTSMAAPHVTGAAAVLLSIAPGLTNERVRQILTSTADDILDPYSDGANRPGYDLYTGWGRINLSRAIAALPEIFVTVSNPQQGQWIGGTVAIRGSASGPLFNGFAVKIASGRSPGPFVWTTLVTSNTPVTDDVLANWNTAGLVGAYTIRVDAGTDAAVDVPVNLVQSPTATLLSPSSGDTVQLLAMVRGTAAASSFRKYRLEAAGPIPAATVRPIGDYTRPVWNDTLGIWKLDQLPVGRYWLRLIVDTDTGSFRDSVTVTVASMFHAGWPVILPATAHFAVATVDLDGDGTDEIICPTARGLWVLKSDGTVYPGWPRDTLSNLKTPPAFADLDGDGRYEIIIATPDSMRVYAFIGEEYAGWPQPFQGGDHLFGVSLPTIGNLDGEDGLEIVAIDKTGRINAWHEDGSIDHPAGKDFGTIKVTNTASYALPRVCIADLDGDGQPELVAAGDDIHVFDGRSGLPFHGMSSSMIRSHYSTHGLVAGDFDGDGRREVAYLGSNVAQGSFFLDVIRPDGVSLPGWPRNISQTVDKYLLYSLSAGDIDGDRQPELFFAPYSLGDGFLYAYHANGASVASDSAEGLFAALPGSASAVALVDIDNDNQPEVVLRIGELLFGPDQIYALEADGSFVSGYPITFGNGSSSVMSAPVVGDVDGDGEADMVTVQSTGRSVALWNLAVPLSLRGRPWPKFQADIWNSGVIPSPNYDIIYLVRMIDMLYRGGSLFPPYESTDLNCDNRINLLDVVMLINYIFSGGAAPCVP